MVTCTLQSSCCRVNPFTSSFLPNLALPFHLPSFSSLSGFPGAFASTKHKKTHRSPARDWSYEHLMVVWDEVFEICCSDPVKATRLRNYSQKGVERYGRGCVLVYESVQTKPRGAGSGFTSKPTKSSLDLPSFVSLDWRLAYVPRDFFLDPSKAPVDAENLSDGTAISKSVQSSPSSNAVEGEFPTENVPANGFPANQENTTNESGQAQVGNASKLHEDDVEVVSQQVLLSSMRGMDLTRLLSLTANFDFESQALSASKPTLIDMKTMDAGGEDPYNPKEEELVLMLYLKVDGRPALGADVLIAYQNETDTSDTEERGSWKLKLRYPI